MDAAQVVNISTRLGEGPVWDQEGHRLLWVDIIGMKINSFHPDSESLRMIQLNKQVSSIALRKNGDLLVSLQDSICSFVEETGQITPIIHLEINKTRLRFNDGKCDPAGRFWVGTMDLQCRQDIGSLYCLDTDGTFQAVFSHVTISNGLAWDSKQQKMYYIDTAAREVWSFDYDAGTGAIRNKRTAVDGQDEAGVFDGMTIDSEDKLWIAHWGGHRVSRWDPDSGVKLGEVNVPVPNVTSCTFGGENLDTLFITTECEGIFAAPVGVRGCATSKYKG